MLGFCLFKPMKHAYGVREMNNPVYERIEVNVIMPTYVKLTFGCMCITAQNQN